MHLSQLSPGYLWKILELGKIEGLFEQ